MLIQKNCVHLQSLTELKYLGNMIQTQLLRLDPPYQIISAKGRVGIQVATLIVVDESDLSHGRGFGTNWVEYHSYPVVSYGLKQGLDEQMKYNNNPLDYEAEWAIRRRLQPEGAVWSGVEVKDVRVLGLAGAQNDPVDLGFFTFLIPTAMGYDPTLHVWDEKSTSLIYELYQGLGNVGVKTPKLPKMSLSEMNDKFPIRLILENAPASDEFFVQVLIKDDPNKNFGEGMPDESIYFRCLIDPRNSDSIDQCAATIAEAINGILQFLPTPSVCFTSILTSREKDKELSEAMKRLASLAEKNYNNLLFPQHD